MNSRPATMAEAAPPPLLGGLPDEIAIWEILVRLPPKDLLRCRAVCRAWRCTTSTRDFLLAHHARQPSLPLSYVFNHGGDFISIDITSFDHQGGVAAPQTVARLRRHILNPTVSCDGLVIFQVDYEADRQLFICNPATRQYGCLPMLFGAPRSVAVGMPFGAPRPVAVGIYSHSPTGEYRLLLLLEPEAPDGSYLVYTYTLGSSQPPGHVDIEGPDVEELVFSRGPFLFRGSLHWCISNMIIAFDTVAESFRQMRTPVVPNCADLFEMDGMLGMSSLDDYNDDEPIVDIWMMQDECEVWALKYRVEIPDAELTLQFGLFYPRYCVVFTSWDGDVVVLVQFGGWLLQLDVDGKLVASFQDRGGLIGHPHQLKQTLVQHTFFPTLEGYVVNAPPFI